MFAFTKLSLARQFMLVSFLILLTGMVVIGFWVGQQIRTGVINRTAAVTSLYVDSFLSPYLQDLSDDHQLDAGKLKELDRLLTETLLGEQIVTFKVWLPDGSILYSPTPSLIGKQFSRDDDLIRAFAGEVVSEISNLDKPEHEYERQYWDTLIETYAPIRENRTGSVIAVMEFYQNPDDLVAEVWAAQMRTWPLVGFATLIMYLLLAGMVNRASAVILEQQSILQEKIDQTSTLLVQNQRLHARVRRAAARATALNERFLRRISSDLHDGPGQDLALALMRVESLAEECSRCPLPQEEGKSLADDFDTVYNALTSALNDLRAIAAGLRLPEIEPLNTDEIVRRAVRDYERKTRQAVTVHMENSPPEVPLPVKITLYRLLQEALANGYRHAKGEDQVIRLHADEDTLFVIISDAGEGFDPEKVKPDGKIGLAGMRERVEALGGWFELVSHPGEGTTVSASLPLTIPKDDDD